RYDPAWIKLEIGGVGLVPAPGEQMFRGLLAPLLLRDAHLLWAGRIYVLVELQPPFLPLEPRWFSDGSASRAPTLGGRAARLSQREPVSSVRAPAMRRRRRSPACHRY